MSPLDRTLADYRGTGLTVGAHIMRYLRTELTRAGVLRAIDLKQAHDGSWVKIAGLVIVRQRPGTAKGFCFLTLEDETGTANAVIVPDVFRRHRTLIHTTALLQVEGPLQKTRPRPGGGTDSVIHVRARRFTPLAIPKQAIHQRGRGYRMRTMPEDLAPPPVSYRAVYIGELVPQRGLPEVLWEALFRTPRFNGRHNSSGAMRHRDAIWVARFFEEGFGIMRWGTERRSRPRSNRDMRKKT